MGDALDQLRPVDQFAYFRSRKAAVKASEALEAAGFVVSQKRAGFRTSVIATRSEILDDESVDSFLNLVITIVESNGGSYDGFGGGVVA
jgi:hypothetical protein